MPDAFEVEVEAYEGVDVRRIASEELFKTAIATQETWRQNLRDGKGANGSRQSGWVNTGEAVNDVTVDPQSEGALRYRVGGDVVQLAIAEWGRTPGAFPPPEPIADWMREKLGIRDPDPYPIQRHIAENGIDGFAPARGAVNEHKDELSRRIGREIQKALDEMESG